MGSNPAIDPVPFGHWTLRNEAAQRRSSSRWGSPSVRQCSIAKHKISRCAFVAACLSSPYRQRRLLVPLGRNNHAFALAKL